jgi:hypothetical protein
MLFTTKSNLAILVVICAISAACGREEPQVPAATTETQASRQPNTATTVTGCLRAGEAANTYVLTTASRTSGETPATYHLTSAGTVNLEDHVGKRVEVSGVVESQSEIATRQAPTPADNATGTAGKPGTPTVQTGTQLSIQRLDVKSVRATGGDCGM